MAGIKTKTEKKLKTSALPFASVSRDNTNCKNTAP
jgi:hypothetical protein